MGAGARIVGLAVVAAVAVGCAATGEPAQVSNTDVVALDEDGVTQTFVARGHNLSRLTVFVATYGAERPPAGVLRLEVVGAGAERTALVDGAELEDNAPVELVFPPIADAAGERFAATLSWDAADQVGLYVNRNDAYPNGELSPGGGDLAFVVGHAGRLRGTIDALARVPGEFGELVARDPVFATVWLLVLAAAGAGIVRARRDRRASVDDRAP